MSVIDKILKHLDAEDAGLTARLRFDKFDTDRTRNQAVGRIKQIDELRDFVKSLVRAEPEDDGVEDVDVTGQSALDPPRPIKHNKPRRW